MTDTLRVILEIGKKRRVVAGAMDWPGLDRWGTSEDDALEKLASYGRATPTSRSGPAWPSAFARAREPEVVERVPGSSSTDFWGIAHVPSQIEREVLSAADLERRLDLLQACWAYFDDVAARVSAELRPGRAARAAAATRSSATSIVNEPEQFSRKVEVRTPRRRRPHAATASRRIGRRTSMRSAPTTRRASRRGPGRSSSSSAARPTTSWTTRGRWRTGDLDAVMTRRALILFALMSVIWGIPYLFIRIAVAEITPATLVLGRTAIAAAILLPIALVRTDLRPVLARWRWVVAFAAVEIAIPWVALGSAEQHISSSLAGLLIAGVPLVGAAIALRPAAPTGSVRSGLLGHADRRRRGGAHRRRGLRRDGYDGPAPDRRRGRRLRARAGDPGAPPRRSADGRDHGGLADPRRHRVPADRRQPVARDDAVGQRR